MLFQNKTTIPSAFNHLLTEGLSVDIYNLTKD